jgi:hypothetical protein
MIEDNSHDISLLSSEENKIVTSGFTEKEVFEVISQIKHNKTSRPDLTEFY